VDDDEASNFLHQLLLENAGITEIHTVLNGQQALDYLRMHCINNQHSCPDIILLDINMPVMDGFEFLEKLPLLGLPENIQIVLLTSSAYAKDVEKAKNYSIHSYLNKPLTEAKLHELFAEIS
jgi:CheY-like chemotaxis protein